VFGLRNAVVFTHSNAAGFLYGLGFVKHAAELTDWIFSDLSYGVELRLSGRLFSGSFDLNHTKHRRAPKCSMHVHLGLFTSRLGGSDFCQSTQI